MIPEPDYSDSEEDTRSEDDYTPNTNRVLERLHDVSEVYVTKENVKKQPNQPKRVNKQGNTTPKITFKDVSDKAQFKSERTSPRVPGNAQSKSPALASGSKSTPARRAKSPALSKKTSAVTKSPTKPTTTVATAKDELSKGKTISKSILKTKLGTNEPIGTKPLPAAVSHVPKTYAVKTPPSTGHVNSPVSSETSNEPSSDEEQLIKPKKVYQVTTERQKLHKELKFSQKYGKLSSSKTELQLALERYTENKVRRDLSAEEKTSLEKILEYQAKKIEMQEAMDKTPTWVENIQTPPSVSDSKTDEFYRVHARVVSSNTLTQCFLPEDEQSEYSSSKASFNSDSGSDN